MEFLPHHLPDVVKEVVEIVPNMVYWAAVDIPTYSSYLRFNHRISFTKPTMKASIPQRSFLGQIDSFIHDQIENVASNEDPGIRPKRKCSGKRVPQLSLAQVKVMYTDKIFTYKPLANDFGPLDLTTTLRYIDFVDSNVDGGTIVIHVSDFKRPNLCSNSACLASIYGLMRHGIPSTRIRSLFATAPKSILPSFRDASRFHENIFPLSIGDICESVEYSMRLRWINWDSFDIMESEHHQHVDNGDLNWIIRDKFVAFAGPSSDCLDEDGLEVHPPKHYVDVFKRMGVTDVVRLNIPNYTPSEFESFGIKHHDLFFEDGSCPPNFIVETFFSRIDKADGAIAVHCKAGLGRSASMIGLAVMRQYRVPARVFIAWARLARPGSVIGPQQNFLVEMEKVLLNRRAYSEVTLSSTKGVDIGQGGRLLKKKRLNSLR
jgi:protein-tyrosine phosphatase